MRKKVPPGRGKTSVNLQGTSRKANGIPPMPPGLDPDAAREWHRLVAERRTQPTGISPADALLLEVAANAFCYRLKIERLVRHLGLTFRPDFVSNDWKEQYLVACHALRCTPAIPIPEDEL